MEFVNLTPFAAQDFTGYDVGDRAYDVVVLKSTYQFVPVKETGGYFEAQLIEGGKPVPLTMGDEHYGEPSSSSVRVESDFIPYKPKCDVLLIGHAHSPYSTAVRQWETRLRVGQIQTAMPQVPQPPQGDAGLSVDRWMRYKSDESDYFRNLHTYVSAPPWAELEIDKTLLVCGPREFTSGLLDWDLGQAQQTQSVPLRWELAYGGGSRVDDPEHPERPLVNAVCFQNPVGCGWVAADMFKALKRVGQQQPRRLAAPQISYPDDKIKRLSLAQQPPPNLDAKRMAQLEYAHRPANYGAVGKAWAPRLALAGTYDEVWEKQRHPWLPKDFDMAYWNGAPKDQQIEFPALFQQKHAIELSGLVSHPHAVNGHFFAWLPPHRGLVLAYTGGAIVPLPMQPDTLVFDIDALRLSITWRTALLKSVGAQKMEARFEINPRAPWVKFKEGV